MARIKKYLLLLLLIPIIPLLTGFYHIAIAEKNINDCMITYVYNIKYNGYKQGFRTYDHIDVKKYKGDLEIGTVKGCLFYSSKNIWLAYSNTLYCNLVYKII